MKVLGVLDSPKGITNHSYSPSLVLNAGFHSSPGRILIWRYPLLRSTLEKFVAPDIRSSISSKREMGKRYLTVILLIAARLSTHIRHVPSFGVKSARTAHGLKLSLMNPLSSNSSTCCNSVCSILLIGLGLHYEIGLSLPQF